MPLVTFKTAVARCRCTPAEKRRWQHSAGGNLSEWLRSLANAEVERVAEQSPKLSARELIEEMRR